MRWYPAARGVAKDVLSVNASTKVLSAVLPCCVMRRPVLPPDSYNLCTKVNDSWQAHVLQNTVPFSCKLHIHINMVTLLILKNG